MSLLNTFFKKNWLFVFCLVIIVFQFSQIFFFNRSLFWQTYDTSYWKNRFEHSQWSLPASHRIIGDDGIYQYAGYQLLHGVSIETTNANKPPVALYLIGISISLLKNPLFSEFLIGIGTIFCFYLLAFELLKDKKLAIMATTLLTLEPFIFSNFAITLLDLPQLFFLLLHLIFLSYAVKSKKFRLLLAFLSALFLGLFAETKPPILLPIIAILEAIYLYKQKLLTLALPMLIGFAIAVIAPYFRYFQLGHSLIDYLKLHKYMASVYYSGHNQLFPLSIWQSLFLGLFPDVVSGKLNRIIDWWPLLPFITALSLWQSIKILLKRNYSIFLKGFSIFCLVVLLIYTQVPSYPRYLILVIPFLYIFTAEFFRKYLKSKLLILAFVIVSLAGLLYSTYLLFPTVDNVLQDFTYSFANQYFQDIYQQNLTVKSKQTTNAQTFRMLTQGNLLEANIVDTKFKEVSRSVPIFANIGQIKYLFTYTTRDLGKFSEEKDISLVKENGQWKIVWDWNLLLNGFKPGDKFITNILPGKRGTIYDGDGNILAEDKQSLLISVNPDKIDTKLEQAMLKLLQAISFQQSICIQNAYLENTLPDTYTAVITPFVNLNQKQLTMLNSYPGIKLTPYISRIYAPKQNLAMLKSNERCTKIYSSSTYHGSTGIEKRYDKILSGQNGGTLSLLNKNAEVIRILINRSSKNGGDVTLP